MIGFEAELNVPTFQAAGDLEGEDAVIAFLFGGFADTDQAVGGNEFFKIKPDVSNYKRAGQEILGPLSAFVPLKKRKLGPDDVRITKMEYETSPPVNEAADNSNDNFIRQARAIKNHSETFFPQAKGRVVTVPSPAEGMWAGIPVAQLETSIKVGRSHPSQEAHTLAEQLDKALKEMSRKVTFEFALQATAGVPPSAIPTLFESEPKPLDQPTGQLAKAWAAGYPMLREFVDTTMNKFAWLEDISDSAKPAFRGHLYLIASYLEGYSPARSVI